MKALRLIGIVIGVIVGLIALAFGVFWFGWLRAPAPQDVCDHVSEIYEEEIGQVMPEPAEKECIDRLAPPEFGKLPYAEKMKCMMDAQTSRELDGC